MVASVRGRYAAGVRRRPFRSRQIVGASAEVLGLSPTPLAHWTPSVALLSFPLARTAVEGGCDGDRNPPTKPALTCAPDDKGADRGNDQMYITWPRTEALRRALAATRREAGVAHPPAPSRQPRTGRGHPSGTVVSSPARLNVYCNVVRSATLARSEAKWPHQGPMLRAKLDCHRGVKSPIVDTLNDRGELAYSIATGARRRMPRR